MQRLVLGLAALASCVAPLAARAGDQAAVVAAPACPARAAAYALTLTWHAPPDEDRETIDRWCRGVGPPLFVPAPAATDARTLSPPGLEDLAIVTWNAHLAEGELGRLVDRLQSGDLTGGHPVTRFVLLIQELFRRGPDVPAFAAEARSARAIAARDPAARDVRDHATALGLSALYVPSMRNGAALYEDRGNAILSSESLLDPFAAELPFERQRRVAVGASIAVRTPDGPGRLHLVNAHLEPLSSPASLWVFRNPRRRQLAALLDLVGAPRFAPGGAIIGTVLGGDFNTIQGGPEEDTYLLARAWSRGLASEDPRPTHRMGRIDYLFVRLDNGFTAATTRVDEKFGSDHHPVIARFARETIVADRPASQCARRSPVNRQPDTTRGLQCG